MILSFIQGLNKIVYGDTFFFEFIHFSFEIFLAFSYRLPILLLDLSPSLALRLFTCRSSKIFVLQIWIIQEPVDMFTVSQLSRLFSFLPFALFRYITPPTSLHAVTGRGGENKIYKLIKKL